MSDGAPSNGGSGGRRSIEDLHAAGLLGVDFFIKYLGDEPSGFCLWKQADAGTGRWYRTKVPAREMVTAQVRMAKTSRRFALSPDEQEEAHCDMMIAALRDVRAGGAPPDQ